MKTNKDDFTIKMLTIVVQGALGSMLVLPLMVNADDAANADAAALKHPNNFVEIGAMNVVHDSAKFGEYNGLEQSGAYGVGNFDMRGGSAYEDGDGTMRYEAKGTNLGTTSRSLGATISDQGKWSLGAGYDELSHNITDSYQTPYQGEMGGNSFRLPGAFGIINTSVPGSTTATGGTRGLTTNQKSYFREEDVHTDRKNKSFSFGYNFDTQWNVQFDYNRLDQTGAKLISTATEARPNGVNIVIPPHTTGTADTTSTTNNTYYAGQAVIVLMNPTHYQTDTVNLALNWTGEKGRLAVSYFGSFFNDKNNSLSWSNPFTANNGTGITGGRASPTGTPDPAGFPVMTMSTAPDNQFHQLNLVGGFDFTKSTKLAGSLSYGRNTQDASFLTNMIPGGLGGLPISSLDGEVINTNANLKLTHQATKELTVTAGFKYNERDNKTSSNAYTFTLVNGSGSLSGTTGLPDDGMNLPFSNKRYQFELAGDYRFNSRNSLHATYDFNKVKRWCNNVDIPCAKAEDNTDNNLGLEYRFKPSDTVNASVGYTYSDRNASYNSDLIWESVIDPNDGNTFGFVPYFEASRKEHIAKASIAWQATDKLDLGLNGRYVHDDYDSDFGVQSGQNWSVNLDATYSYSESGTVTAYASMMKRWRTMLNTCGNTRGTTATSNCAEGTENPATYNWTNKLDDEEDSIGISARHKGLMGGKLDLAGNLAYVYGNTGYNTNLLYTANYPAALVSGSTPDITSKMLQLKLSGDYKVDKHSTIALGYLYQRLNSKDYQYNGVQMGFTPSTLLPTNQQDQSYSVNLVTATYSYNF